jgi:hypothetical protein
MRTLLLVEDNPGHVHFLREVVEQFEATEIVHVDSLADVRKITSDPKLITGVSAAVVDLAIYNNNSSSRPGESPRTDWGLKSVELLSKRLPKSKILILSSFARDVQEQLDLLGVKSRVFDKDIHSDVFRDEVLKMLSS